MYFTNNEARFAGGAVYADESSTTVPADVYNHTLGTGANGACFIRFPRNFGGQVSFVCSAVFMMLKLLLEMLFKLMQQ